MTVKLLCEWTDSRTGIDYVAGDLLSIDSATEAGLVAAKIAESSTATGTFPQKSLLVNGEAIGVSRGQKSVILWGDSTWGNTNVNSVPATDPVYDKTTGILTLNITGHGFYHGMDCRVACTGFPVWNTDNLRMFRVDANTVRVKIAAGIEDTIPPAAKWRFYSTVAFYESTPFPFLKASRPYIVNMGVNGETVSEIFARKNAVLNHPAKCVFLRFGANNASTDTAGALNDLALAEPVIRDVLQAGKTLVLTKIPPVGSGANQGRYISTLNSGLVDLSKRYGLLIADEYSVMVDPASATGAARSGYLQSDLTHNTPKGSRLLAEAVWQPIVDQIFGPAVSPVPKTALDGYHATNNPSAKNIFSNPTLLTTTGGQNGSGATITATAIANGLKVYATGGFAAGAVVADVVSANDGIGNAQRLTASPTAALDQFKITGEGASAAEATAMAGRIVAGGVYKGVARGRVTGITGQSVVRACTFQISMTVPDGTYGKILDHSWNASLSVNDYLQKDFEIDFETPLFTVPDGVTSIYTDLRLTFGAAGTPVSLECSSIGIVKVN